MLALAIVLARQPSCLILDEVSAGLSPQIAKEVFKQLMELKAKRALTMLVIEQQVSPILDNADRIIVLDQGSIALEVKEVKTRSRNEVEKLIFNHIFRGNRNEKV